MNIPTKFFGLNKQEVKEYFEDLYLSQDKVIDELQSKKRQLEKEKERLVLELNEAKKEEIRYEDEVVSIPGKPIEVTDESRKRAEKITVLIGVSAEEEISKMMNKANDKLSKYDAIISEIDEEFNENKMKFESMLSEVSKTLRSNIDKLPFRNFREADEIPSRSLITEEPLKYEDDIAHENAKQDNHSLINFNEILMLRKKYETENEEIEPEKSSQNFMNDILNGIETDDPYEQAENAKQEEAPQSQPTAVKGDFKQKRNELIIGKMAGKDLTDGEGRVIIEKGKTLTNEDILLAEQEAKLPELIVNMVLVSTD